MSPEFAKLFSRYGVLSLDKQEVLSDVIGENDWQADLVAGTLTFGGEITFPLQLLGSESELSNTWLWSWANEGMQDKEAILTSASEARKYGQTHRVPELALPHIPLDEVTGHEIAMVVTGLLDFDAYYRGPYENGAAFMMLRSPELRARSNGSALHFCTIYPQFIAQFECDHREALLGYAAYRNYAAVDEGARMVLTSPFGEAITADFDSLGRNVNLETTVSRAGVEASYPEKKPWWKVW